MAAKIIDLDTSAAPFTTKQPARLTETDTDTVRVSVAINLAHRRDTTGPRARSTDKLDSRNGLDLVTMLAGETSDAERSAAVAEVVLRHKYIARLLSEPVVVTDTLDGAPRFSISFEALTTFGTTFSLTTTI